MRLFIGFDVSKEVDEELCALQKYLNPDFDNCTHFHITLKFLGEIPDDKVEKIKEKLKQIDFDSFKLTLDHLGVFPNEDSPRILWVGINPHDKLVELQKQIDNIYGDSFESNDRFHPHITLFRLGHVLDPKAFIENMKKLDVHLVEFEVREINLYESDLSGGYPIYTIIEKKESND